MTLSTSAVINAGAALARTAGIGFISMRAVAAELDVTPMALYRHLSDADALLGGVVELLVRDTPVPPDSGDTMDNVRAWASDARVVLGGAPGLATFVLQNWITLPSVLQAVEGLGQTFRRAGLSEFDAVAGANAVFTYVLMRCQAEETVREARTRDLTELRRRKTELPFLWNNRHEYATPRFDRHFAYGLEALLSGIVDGLE